MDLPRYDGFREKFTLRCDNHEAVGDSMAILVGTHNV
jgi:hypothetical protein